MSDTTTSPELVASMADIMDDGAKHPDDIGPDNFTMAARMLRDLSAALTAAAERETKLREELEQLRGWKRNVGIQSALDRAYNEGGAAERQKVTAMAEVLSVIHKTVRGDEKSECRTIRAYMDRHGMFNGDIGSSDRLIELVCGHGKNIALGLIPDPPREK